MSESVNKIIHAAKTQIRQINLTDLYVTYYKKICWQNRKSSKGSDLQSNLWYSPYFKASENAHTIKCRYLPRYVGYHVHWANYSSPWCGKVDICVQVCGRIPLHKYTYTSFVDSSILSEKIFRGSLLENIYNEKAEYWKSWFSSSALRRIWGILL